MLNKQYFLIFSLLLSYQVWAQKSISLSSNKAKQGEYLELTVQGIETHFSAGKNTLNFFRNGLPTQDITATETFVLSGTTMKHLVQVSPNCLIGNYTFSSKNPEDVSINGSHTFSIFPDTGTAQVLSVYPTSVQPYAAQNIILTGVNTHFYQNNNTLLITTPNTGIIPRLIKAIDNTHLIISLDIPSHVLGFVDLTISNSIDGNLSLTNAFVIEKNNGPQIIQVSPRLIPRNQKKTLRVTGKNTQFMYGNSEIYLYHSSQPPPNKGLNIVGKNSINDSTIDLFIEIDSLAERGSYHLQIYTSPFYVFLMDAIEITWANALNETSSFESIQVYPNPSFGSIQISASTPFNSVEFYDLQGKWVRTETFENPQYTCHLNTATYLQAANCYLLKINGNHAIYLKKITIQ